MATIGTYQILPSHSGGTILGAYVPGAGLDYWTDPKPFVAAVEPELLEQDQASISRGELRLALGEFWRRPRFHAIRILAGSLSAILRNDFGLLYWSMTGPGTLPRDAQLTALRLLDRVGPILHLGAPLGVALFIFSLGIVSAGRSGVARVLTPLLAAIGLKIAIHGLAVAQPRYYLPAIALAILVIAVCVDALFLRDLRKVAILSAGAALLGVAALNFSLGAAERYVQSHDLVPQMTYRFPLRTGTARLSCLMTSGRLLSLYQQQFTVQLSAGETLPPLTATVQCSSSPTHNPITLIVESTSGATQAAGRSPIVQVDVNGARVLEADARPAPIAEWLVARAGPYPEDTPISMDVRVVFSQATSHLTPSPTVTFRVRSR